MDQRKNTTIDFDTLLKSALAVWPALAISVMPMIESKAMNDDAQIVMEERWTAPQRVLIFPTQVSLGAIITQPDWHPLGKTVPHKFLMARGTIVVPKDQLITLQASPDFFAHPELISQLPANAIDCLELKLMSMSDAEDLLCDRALAHIGNLKGLKILILDKSEVTDAGMKQIAGLTNLEYLSAFLTPLNGSFLKDLRSLKKLRALVIPCNGLREEELKYLPEYPSLQYLLLSRTNLTDKGLQYIAGCPTLKKLDLSKNPGVTDGSVQYLKQLTALKDLSVDGTSITIQGLIKLKGLNLRLLTLPEAKYPPEQLALVHSTFPRASVFFRGGPKKVDDETSTVYGQMSRGRHF